MKKKIKDINNTQIKRAFKSSYENSNKNETPKKNKYATAIFKLKRFVT